MGHKVHPIGFRIGIIKGWQSRWYDEKHYAEFLLEDVAIRRAVRGNYGDAGVSLIEIERGASEVSVTVHTSRPGIVIGRSGQRVDELRALLERQTGKRVRVNVQEIPEPELDAYLVARSVADQLERRVAYRRAIKQAVSRSMQRGAKGVKIQVAGRLGGAEIARREMERDGSVPLHTLRADVDYGFAEARTPMGRIGVKAWIYKGQVMPRRRGVEELEAAEIISTGEGPEMAVEEERAPTAEIVAEAPAEPTGEALPARGAVPEASSTAAAVEGREGPAVEEKDAPAETS